jgi:protoporphyrinogen oxidase
MPIRELIACIKPAPPTLVKDIASNLQYRDFLTVGLLLRKMNIQTKTGVVTEIKDNWIYIQEGDVMVGRIQIFNNWSPGMVADPSTVWIGLEYFLNDTDDLWNMQDEDLINFGAQEMAKIGMIIKEDVLDGCVRRMPKAYPTYAGSYESIDTVKEYIDTVDNLYLIGRNGMHRYNNQDHSMLTAMLAVEDIIGGGGGKKALWDVNAQQQYHETKTES